MMRVRCLISVHATRIYETIRRFVCLHIANTSACQMRTKAKLLIRASAVMSFQPVCVHTLTRRMIRRKIQFIKRIHFTCDLVFLEHLESHRTERIVQVITHLRDRVKSAACRQDTRNRTVKIRRHFRSFQLQLHPLLIDQVLHFIFRLIQKFSHLRTKRHIHCRDLFHQKT